MKEPFRARSALFGQDNIRFLEQLTDDAFWDYAIACAQPASSQQVQIDQFVICDIGSNAGCLIALTHLHAVVSSPSHISLLPATPEWMLGITTWSDKVLAVADLRAYLAQGSSHSPYSTMLVAQHEHILLGIVTSVIRTLAYLDEAQIVALPESAGDYLASPCASAFKGIYTGNQSENPGEQEIKPLLVLDIPAVLTDIVKHLQATATYG